MPQESVTAKWLANLPANVANGVGILLFQTETSIHDVLARELGKSDLEDSGLLILDHLTEEVLSDLAAVNRIREQVITAITSRRPIAASTPLTPPMLAGSQASSAHPSEIDVEELVGRPELAYLLESSCAVASNSEPGSGANYLTAIEKRLAQALSADGIHYREQVPIGRHRVDFLISKTSQPGKLIVECDGAAFHDPELDARRDEVLRAQGYEILRFTGSQIYREAAECAKRVAQALKTQIQPVFIARRDKLSDDQALAVSHTVGPARVAAPAGSGKTRVIENRIQRLVAEGADPNRICAISFTNTAVDEMRHRLGKKAPLLAESVTFTTIHALAKKTAESAGIKKTLVENVRSGQARDTTTLTQLVEQVLDASEYTKQRGGLTSWLDAIKSYRAAFTLPDFREWPDERTPTPDRFREVCKQVETLLARDNLTDYEGWIHDALRALASDPSFRALQQARFDYWIVDEYQDLPLGKLNLLRLLVAPARNVFVVGDDDQVIYGFAGASPDIFTEFQEHFPGASRYLLSTNYRSTNEIVEHTQRLITNNVQRVNKNSRPHREPSQQQTVTLPGSNAYENVGAEFIITRLNAGVKPDKIALLFRLKDMAIPLERRLTLEGIPYIPCSNESFYDDPVVRSIRAWLDLCGATDPDWLTAIDKALNYPSRYLQRPTRKGAAEFVSSQLPQTRKEAIAFLAEYASKVGSEEPNSVMNEQQRDHMASAIQDACDEVSAIDDTRPSDILDTLRLRDRVRSEQARPNSKVSRGAEPIVVYDILYRLAAQFESVDELNEWITNHADDPAFRFRSEDGSVRNLSSKVVLSTIHGAKGREWDHVAVLGPQDGMPDWRAREPEHREEERRIAYVAATRAKESLLFCASRQYAREMDPEKRIAPFRTTFTCPKCRESYASYDPACPYC